MEIIKDLTNVNRSVSNNRKIEYIVIHYVGAVSTAKNNASYFKNIDRQSSAHYFIDENEIYQIVEDKDVSWHCGSNKYYCNARNSNSIGVEMCCFKNDFGKLDVSNKVIERTIELVKVLMQKYNIDVDHVIRHYDVSHKVCPAPFVNDEARWTDFKSRLEQSNKITNTDNKNVLDWQKNMNKCYGCGITEDNKYESYSKKCANKYYLHYKSNTIKNEHVRFIQNRLISKGFNCGEYGADGSYGPDTLVAVKAFQKARGLTVDGYVGAKTTEVLLK